MQKRVSYQGTKQLHNGETVHVIKVVRGSTIDYNYMETEYGLHRETVTTFARAKTIHEDKDGQPFFMHYKRKFYLQDFYPINGRQYGRRMYDWGDADTALSGWMLAARPFWNGEMNAVHLAYSHC
jgi:hypothetical protein